MFRVETGRLVNAAAQSLVIPELMTLGALADVRELLSHRKFPIICDSKCEAAVK